MLETQFKFSDSQYMLIVGERIEGRKTPIFYIAERGGGSLGEIRWYAPWRSFCFFSYADKVFDHGCMSMLLHWLEEANAQWKRK